MKEQNRFAKMSELLLDVLSEQTQDQEEMLSYLGYTATMLLNTGLCKEHRYEAVMDFIECMLKTIDRTDTLRSHENEIMRR